MTRSISLLLKAALLLTAIAAVTFAIRILLQQMLNVGTWYWGGAFAVFTAPAAIALALYVLENTDSTVPRRIGKRADALQEAAE